MGTFCRLFLRPPPPRKFQARLNFFKLWALMVPGAQTSVAGSGGPVAGNESLDLRDILLPDIGDQPNRSLYMREIGTMLQESLGSGPKCPSSVPWGVSGALRAPCSRVSKKCPESVPRVSGTP